MRQKNAYSKLTGHYDDVLTGRKWWSRLYMHGLWRVDDNRVASEVLEMIPNGICGTVLDVPVGTAVFTASKYLRMGNAQITGLDYSDEMIKLAELRAKQERIENLTLLQGDIGELPFENEAFDCVLSMNGFQAFPDKERAFAEVYRVLKPGGLFCGCFYVKGESRISDWIVRNVLNRKGLFLPPHYTKAQAEEKLHSMFGPDTYVRSEHSILIFKCTKP
ncbi:MAG: class I SAM-dependent methyltransferase [Porphyromonas sp.]|nr:class I SAM-dependent methyltransferase [Porphyromonas sp.]